MDNSSLAQSRCSSFLRAALLLSLGVPGLGWTDGLHAQSLSLSTVSTVARGEAFTVTLEGSAPFDLAGFAARVVYDPGELICTGQSFADGVWEDADFRSVDDVVPGSIGVVAVEDTSNSGEIVQGGNNRVFVALFFEARVCPGPVVIGFGGALDDNVLVDTAAVGFDVLGASLKPVTVQVVTGSSFVRGNANNSPVNAVFPDATEASVTIADAIFMLTNLFGQGVAPTCLDAADANNDGRYDIIDAVTVLQVLFDNPLVFIPEPHVNIGLDEDGESLGCQTAPDVINCP